MDYIDPFGLDTLDTKSITPDKWKGFQSETDVLILEEVVVTAKKDKNNPPNYVFAYSDVFIGGAEHALGRSLDRYNRFDGVRSYKPYRYKDLVHTNPALRTRPINIQLEVPFF